jgi:hypothetical protein
MAQLLASGELMGSLPRRISLEEAPNAVIASRTGHADGKTVIIPGGS